MYKLCLNAGHSYTTRGKRCSKKLDPNETREYVLNKRVCDKIETKLKCYTGIAILRIDDGTEISIADRCRKANNYKGNLYLSIHHNAGAKNGIASGIECYVFPRVDKLTENYQSSLYSGIISTTGNVGNRKSPLRRADFAELRLTNMCAVLIECGYMDSVIDTPKILTDSYAEQIAEGVVNTLVSMWGLKLSEPQNSLPVDVKSDYEIAQEVIRGMYGNGKQRKNILTSMGRDYTAIQKIVNSILKKK